MPVDERFRSSVDIPGLIRIERLAALEAAALAGRRFSARSIATRPRKASTCSSSTAADATDRMSPTPLDNAPSAPLKPTPELEWRIEVIPLEHIGTDPTAARGFVERTYDLSPTGIKEAEMEGAFKPLLVRALARDTRFRLTEVVRLRTEQKLPLGDLASILAAYPDPDANVVPALPLDEFRRIDAALATLLTPLPDVTTQPDDPLDCALDCHTQNLLWDVRNGASSIDTKVTALDITKLNEGLALNLVGILIKNKFYGEYGVDYATQQCLEGFRRARLAAGRRRLQAAAARRRVGDAAVPAQRLRADAVIKCSCRPDSATRRSSSGVASSILRTSAMSRSLRKTTKPASALDTRHSG